MQVLVLRIVREANAANRQPSSKEIVAIAAEHHDHTLDQRRLIQDLTILQHHRLLVGAATNDDIQPLRYTITERGELVLANRGL